MKPDGWSSDPLIPARGSTTLYTTWNSFSGSSSTSSQTRTSSWGAQSLARNPTPFLPKRAHRHRIVEHWNFGLTLFAGREGRKDVMAFDGRLGDHLARNPLHPAIAPLAEVIVQLRDALAGTCEWIELNPPAINHNSGREVHKVFTTLLRFAGTHLQKVPFDVQVRSL